MITQEDRNYAASILEEEAYGQDKAGQQNAACLRAVAEELRAVQHREEVLLSTCNTVVQLQAEVLALRKLLDE